MFESMFEIMEGDWKVLSECLETMLNRDKYLLEKNVHEQTLSTRLACYLSSYYETQEWWNYNVDCEYNRNFNNPKILENISNKNGVRPDIIIHKRWSNDDNLLVIEIKKDSNAEAQSWSDDEKLRWFTSSDDQYRYTYWVYLMFDTEGLKEYKIYKKGNIISSWERPNQ